MNIVIEQLSPQLSAEYFDFFENRAFTDDSPYRCYCQLYQMTKEQAEAELEGVDGADVGRVCRKVAQRQIDENVLRGYLAFVEGVAIGWCNANDSAGYPAQSVNGARFHVPTQGRVKIVACFEIAPEFRGKGVATALLRRVVADARAEGYDAVLGFPMVRSERFEWDNPGPLRLYEKAGFVKTGEQDGFLTMSKELQHAHKSRGRGMHHDDLSGNRHSGGARRAAAPGGDGRHHRLWRPQGGCEALV